LAFVAMVKTADLGELDAFFRNRRLDGS